jgi:hypothetical protein
LPPPPSAARPGRYSGPALLRVPRRGGRPLWKPAGSAQSRGRLTLLPSSRCGSHRCAAGNGSAAGAAGGLPNWNQVDVLVWCPTRWGDFNMLAGENANLLERQCPLCCGPIQVIRVDRYTRFAAGPATEDGEVFRMRPGCNPYIRSRSRMMCAPAHAHSITCQC